MMGQQQILLLVFGIVIVGSALVASTQAVEDGIAQNNQHLVLEEALTIASDIQAWKLKPALLGGGAGTTGFDSLDFEKLGYTTDRVSNRVYQTKLACYTLQTFGPEHDVDLTISAPSCEKAGYISRIVIRGSHKEDLSLES